MGQLSKYLWSIILGHCCLTSCSINFEAIDSVLYYTVAKRAKSMARNYQDKLLRNSEISYQEYLRNIENLEQVVVPQNSEIVFKSEWVNINSRGRIDINKKSIEKNSLDIDNTSLKTSLRSNGAKVSVKIFEVYTTVSLSSDYEIWVYLIHIDL